MSLTNKDHTFKECGCKGIRRCLQCQTSTSSAERSCPVDDVQVQRIIYEYCVLCKKAWLQETCVVATLQHLAATATNEISNKQPERCASIQSCSHDHDGDTSMDFLGIDVIENFVTKEEEDFLDTTISFTSFMKSQSGRRKQDFGPKVNFKKQKLKTGNFCGLPSYSRFLYERMKDSAILKDFEPVEMCNLEYSSDRGAHIDPHFDDTWLWGERLVTLNLISNSILSFTHDSQPDVVIQVPLQQRSLLIVYGPARYEWKHSIDSKDISGKRIAMTFRELSDEFKGEGVRCEEGQEFLELALTFQGVAVGSVL